MTDIERPCTPTFIPADETSGCSGQLWEQLCKKWVHCAEHYVWLKLTFALHLAHTGIVAFYFQTHQHFQWGHQSPLAWTPQTNVALKQKSYGWHAKTKHAADAFQEKHLCCGIGTDEGIFWIHSVPCSCSVFELKATVQFNWSEWEINGK